VDLAPFTAMVKGTRCKLLVGEEAYTAGGDLTLEEEKALERGENVAHYNPHRLSTLEHAQRAARWYAGGADGVEVYNGPAEWDTLKVLGSLERVNAYLDVHK
jgi:hypothetical protein